MSRPASSLVTLVTLALVATVLLCPAPALGAGHVVSTVGCPALPDPGYDSALAPQVSGNAVVYSASDESYAGDYYAVYNWTVGAATAVDWPAIPWRGAGDFDGGVAVYEGSRAGHSTIRATNGVLDVEIAAGSYSCKRPRISGDRVVWQQDPRGDWDIAGATIDPATLAPVSTYSICRARKAQTNPDIDGQIVTWQDKRSGGFDIRAREFGSPSVVICNGRHGQDSPRVGDGWIAWVDWRNKSTGGDIYARRFSSGPVKAICRARRAQKEPDVSGGFIVWTDWRNVAHPEGGSTDTPRDTDIRAWDLTTGTSFRVAHTSAMECEPDIDGGTVVYDSLPDDHMGEEWFGSVYAATLAH